jgi:hypothetical protein
MMRDPTPPPSLSRDGERRRDQILRLALEASGQRRRRRQARRAVGLVLLLATAIGFGVRLRHGTPTRQARSDHRAIPGPAVSKNSTPAPVASHIPTIAPARSPRPQVVITRIQTDAGLTDRLSIRPDPAGWQRLTDDDLLRRLSDVGKPAGLAYVDGRAMLLFHNEPHDGTRTSSLSAPQWRTASPSNRHAHDSQPF